ncbi:UDP-N-acetylmuramate--L-alanine ligase [Clostridiaceae bacterium NSJ-31]|uniref:UDP-N-acetylmuramate--L-alanine ligase n=1 Tax=Ligaoa zhengdingensis TaxID=2763658 RepID=A0A926I511_9FIRM|nr:UDP-N-acetylmuramate--L-alanine ligase [Ligaoa zhengdingensis]MBC8546965.1 UDP-N-acetylmuramate--L-alanine ligase [Ligaoa zhengdingensis]
MTKIENTILEGKRHIHFIGIGGSGMFPLVQILHAQGYHITGSDNNETDTVAIERRELGIHVTIGQRAENIAGADLIVYTAAILKDNPELVAAKQSGVPCLERAQLLGLITKEYQNCVCVCGTHGKTTTTSMLTQIALGAGLDPTVVIGGKLEAIHGSGRVGESELMICEACEFCDHFLLLDPNLCVILNIDADHLDYFGTLENVIRSFRRFAELTSGAVIVNGSDANAMKVVEGLVGREIVTFGWESTNDYYPANVVHAGAQSSFDLMQGNRCIAPISVHVPGRHNILNAVAACVAALCSGAPADSLGRELEKFHGAGRRFEILGKVDGVTIADDYAHHPTEIEATLRSAKELDFKRVWAVFQPFTYSRTAMLMDDFARVLSIADHVVLSEIMGGREVNTYNIYAKDLAEKISGSVWFETFPEIANYVLSHAEPGDLVITLGCGDVNKCAHLMVGR